MATSRSNPTNAADQNRDRIAVEDEETWTCIVCGYQETVPFDEVAGDRVVQRIPASPTSTSEDGWEVTERAACPECGAIWKSDTARELEQTDL